MIENSKEKIKEEYKAIQSFSESLEKTCIASKANEKLNRYTNISPFDYNRVVLNDDEFENDYINACKFCLFIKLLKLLMKYLLFFP